MRPRVVRWQLSQTVNSGLNAIWQHCVFRNVFSTNDRIASGSGSLSPSHTWTMAPASISGWKRDCFSTRST